MTTSHSDDGARAMIAKSINMLVPWYLMAAYAYYVLDAPIISDALFDSICRKLDKRWDQVEHVHKVWIDRDDLSAGTRMSTVYPSMAKGAACALAGVPYDPPWGLTDAMKNLGDALDMLTKVIHAEARS